MLNRTIKREDLFRDHRDFGHKLEKFVAGPN